MRIRKATIAGATALAVAFGGTAVASAAEGSNDSATNSSATAGEQQGTQKAGGSSELGKALDADKEANGQNIFGQNSSISGEPKWAQALAGIGIVATIITIAGGLVGPALNYLKFGM
ncbi:hypothetical protein [Corynebacterium sp. HMSC078A10]|uniref:hypothetical protein n=1 Tax=Corynebacterium sp. HMSC078A10 TaxID=1739312 RepID=UPI0008A21931|nr:hypothetical protein [Corynebacterium sp. HMSC078A10]OFK61404.1 hypothetical protein HMPREF2808_03935 [Corynebacterium sp. HMSC078A10]